MKRIGLLPLLLLVMVVAFTACKKDKPQGNNLVNTIKVYGAVSDENGEPLSNATITFNGTSVISSNGLYVFDNATVPGGRQVIKARLDGYYDAIVGFQATSSTSTRVNITLVTRTVVSTLQSTGGGTVNKDGAAVVLPANGMATASGAAYTGDVNVFANYYNPVSDNFRNMIPGGDLVATVAGGDGRALSTYGMVRVEMEDGAGNALQLAAGKSATITWPIAADQQATAPATIEMWHLNEQTGIWEEEGTATRQGNTYVGSVSHFSTWNCDHPEQKSYIKGLLVDCNNKPIRSADLFMVDNSNGGTKMSVTCDEQGHFEATVLANVTFTVKAVPVGMDASLAATLATVGPLNPGESRDLGTLTMPCGVTVKGRLVDNSGLPVSGMLRLESLPTAMAANVWNGEFEFTLAFNKTYTLYPFCLASSSFNQATTFTTPGSPAVIDLGDIPTCSSGGTTNADLSLIHFTANGLGMVNEVFRYDLAQSGLAQVIYSPADTTFIFNTSGQLPNAGGTMQLIVSFKGTQTGSYILGNNLDNLGGANVTIQISRGNSNYTSFTSTSGSFQLTQLGGPGQISLATFSGTFDYADTQTSTNGEVTISNGSVTGVRVY